MSNFADLINDLKELNSKMDESSKKSESLFETLGNNPILSRLVFPISTLILKITGLTKVMRVFQSAEARRNKEMQKQAGGYKFLVKQFKAMEDAVAGGSETAENYMAMLNELQKIGVISAKGKPTGGFFNKIKLFIATGLKVFKNFIMFGTLIVLGIALLVPLIQKNLPKIKEIIPTLKQKFTEVMEFLSPLFESIKAFFSILFDPNASWMDKLNAWFKVVWELLLVTGKTLLAGVVALVTKAVPAILKFIITVAVPAILRFGGELFEYLKTQIPIAIQHLADMVSNFVAEKKSAIGKGIGTAAAGIGGGALAAGGVAAGLQVAGVASVAGVSAPVLIAGAGVAGAAGLGYLGYKHLSGKAMGGPVMAGRPYMVGERGPELFTPDSSGKITSNHNIRSALSQGTATGGGQTIHIHVNGRFGATSNELNVLGQRLGQMINKGINRRTSSGVRL